MNTSSEVVGGRGRLIASGLFILLVTACTPSDGERAASQTSAPPSEPLASAVDVDDSADTAASEPVLSATTFLTDYRAGVARTWAAGVATPEAKELFQETFVDWESQWELLKENERQEVRIPQRPELLWTTTVSEEVTPEGEDVVTLEQCLDATNTGSTRRGELISPQPESPTSEHVTLRRSGDTWKITKYEETGTEC